MGRTVNKPQYLRYLVRRWTDPYNERGEYQLYEFQTSNKQEAIQLAQEGDRAIVLDIMGNNHINQKLIYSRGYS